jgi:hypothetical protein
MGEVLTCTKAHLLKFNLDINNALLYQTVVIGVSCNTASIWYNQLKTEIPFAHTHCPSNTFHIREFNMNISA